MNKITLKIGKNGTYKNISELIQKVSVTGRRGDAPRTLRPPFLIRNSL